MRVLLVSTYDLGRQPFGLASPAAWLTEAGAEVRCLDLAVEPLDEVAVRAADLIAFYLPMHTATRLAVQALARCREFNDSARVAFYGLYAAMNESYLRSLGADAVIGGEFEAELARWVRHEVRTGPRVSLERLAFRIPARGGLPALSRYAHLHAADGTVRTVGATEASRGCKHHCRHCPIVPVYNGVFRIVPRDVVLDDVRRQVAAGAEHITFGDPDFFNGIGHAIPIVRALHQEHPRLSYDVTIKIEHLLRHQEHLATLRDTGCAFVTSAVESVDDRVLARLAKGHTRADFIEVARRFRESGLTLHPTFVAFHPWISIAGYRELLEQVAALDLIEHVAPVQLAIRLLIPAGSRLLELDDVRELVAPFDPVRLCHPWRHADPRVDELHVRLQALVQARAARGESRGSIFEHAWRLAAEASGREDGATLPPGPLTRTPRAPVPFLTEPWYC